MELGLTIALIVVALIAGILFGYFIGLKRKIAAESRGVLYVNCDAPEGQGLFLEQSVPTSVMASEKMVRFEVVVIK